MSTVLCCIAMHLFILYKYFLVIQFIPMITLYIKVGISGRHGNPAAPPVGEELRSDDEAAAPQPLPVRARLQRTEPAMVSHAKVAHENRLHIKEFQKYIIYYINLYLQLRKVFWCFDGIQGIERLISSGG